ncbi:hypothetical protein [Moraxella lacunata]
MREKMRYLSFIIVCVFALSGCDAKDQCLDNGGSYNETTKQCEK